MEKYSICPSEKAEISYNEPYHPHCIENYITNDFEFKNISEKLIQISYILSKNSRVKCIILLVRSLRLWKGVVRRGTIVGSRDF